MSYAVSNQDAVRVRTHAEIVREIGATKLHGLLVEAGFEIRNVTTVQRWADRNSIPGEYWNAIAEAGLATLDELAASADPRLAAQPAAAE